ncbi:unnamed protein product [Ectocarpus sp. 13 AM-2016]
MIAKLCQRSQVNKQLFAQKAFLKVDIGCVRRVTEPLCDMGCVMYVDCLLFLCIFPFVCTLIPMPLSDEGVRRCCCCVIWVVSCMWTIFFFPVYFPLCARDYQCHFPMRVSFVVIAFIDIFCI